MISRMNHVQICIPPGSEAEARAFYCGILGLPEIEKPDSLNGRGGLWLQIGDAQIHLGIEQGIDYSKSRVHIAYQVDDLAYWRERITQHSAVVLESIPIPGYDRFECRDPFGNRMEFIQPHAS